MTEQPTTEQLSAGWRLVLAALVVGAAVSAVRAAQALGIDSILATALSATGMLLAGVPALDLTRISGPIGRVSRSLAADSPAWAAIVGQGGSRIPVTVLVAVAGILAGLAVEGLSLLIPAWLAVVLVVASLHLTYRAVLARLDTRPPRRSRLAQVIVAEASQHPAVARAAEWAAGEPDAQRIMLVLDSLARGVLAAVGRAVLLWLLALPVGWALAAVGLTVSAVLVSPSLARQVGTRAIRSGGSEQSAD